VSEDCLFTFNNCEENSIAGFVRNILHIQCCVKEQDVDKLQTAGLVLGKKVNQSHYRPEVPREFQEVKVPALCDSGLQWW